MKPEDVKLLAAVLYQDRQNLDDALDLLSETFSTTDFHGDFFPFAESDYYEPEMGTDLKRLVVSFEQLVQPDFLVESKLRSRDLERKLSRGDKRRVNIDMGYLDLFKIVLASFKGRGNKIYMSDGVWADMVLYFENGQFRTFLWGFPDFNSGIYDDSFLQIRDIYKTQLKRER